MNHFRKFCESSANWDLIKYRDFQEGKNVYTDASECFIYNPLHISQKIQIQKFFKLVPEKTLNLTVISKNFLQIA